jgi:meiotically up-regulated gene 157 (Mug157) protein
MIERLKRSRTTASAAPFAISQVSYACLSSLRRRDHLSGFRASQYDVLQYLASTAEITGQLYNRADLATRMQDMASTIRNGIESIVIVNHSIHGKIYAYEIDGFGSHNIMDDANIPSLLSAPLLGYTFASDDIYQNTRKMILSEGNPYFMRGRVINAVGGPHNDRAMRGRWRVLCEF